jgi:hypothetical protein
MQISGEKLSSKISELSDYPNLFKLYRTSGVIFFIDYHTAIRDT